MYGFACVFRKSSEPKDIPENLLTHRGPDFNNQIRLPNMCLRHWRLSIKGFICRIKSADYKRPVYIGLQWRAL